MATTKYNRLSDSEVSETLCLYTGGYRSSDYRWLIIRSGYQWQVWESVTDDEVCSEDGRFPWFIADPYAMTDKLGDRFYVHRWDSLGYADAKIEIARFGNL